MKLQDILFDHAEKTMDIRTTDGKEVTAGSWTIGDEVVEGHVGARDASGYSIYVAINQITSIRAY